MNADEAVTEGARRWQRAEFYVHGLDCAEDVGRIGRALRGHRGINAVEFDLIHARMLVQHDPREPGVLDRVRESVSRVGLRAEPWSKRPVDGVPREARRPWRGWGLFFSGLILALASLIEAIWLPGMQSVVGGWVAPLLLVSVLTANLVPIVPRAFKSALSLQADMNVLMTVATVGAAAIGQLAEAATVAWLFVVSLALEDWTVRRARKAIAALMQIAPKGARVWDADHQAWRESAVDSVRPGDRIEVRPGERIPLDGTILVGQGYVDQSPITGESTPVHKQAGEEVLAGSIVLDFATEMAATQTSANTVLARVIRQVEEARSRRGETQRWVDQFAAVYTPVVMVLAAGVAVLPPTAGMGAWSTWLYRALVLLVIACPCALVISTPVTIVAALAAAARRGVLIKGGRFLELAARVRVVALDKTGTLTRGRPSVREVAPVAPFDRGDLIRIAASLEAKSSHPMAAAIVDLAAAEGIHPLAVDSYRSLAGLGLEGQVSGETVWMGGPRLMSERAERHDLLFLAASLERSGCSVVAVGGDRGFRGFLCLADELRPDAHATVESLRQLGTTRVAILTGDNAVVANEIARQAAIAEVYSALMPEDKLRVIHKLRAESGCVAMVGDGINDAPALAAADLGIALGAAGSDVAIETADIAVMTDELSRIPWLIRHARRTLSVVKQNMAFALGLKLAFLALGVWGMAPMWLAVAADTGASLAVTANGMRMLWPRG